MNNLKGIPIAIAGCRCVTGPRAGNAVPILHEIEVAAERSRDHRENPPASICAACPAPRRLRESSSEVLGQGEVSATIDALGPTQVRETAIHGVWWVTHYNGDGTVIAEFIEVTICPRYCRTHPADARVGLDTAAFTPDCRQWQRQKEMAMPDNKLWVKPSRDAVSAAEPSSSSAPPWPRSWPCRRPWPRRWRRSSPGRGASR